MSSHSDAFSPAPFAVASGGGTAPVSPSQAFSRAFEDALGLLFKPFDLGRWFRLSVICLFLGGGAPSAAFNWSLGSLPGDIGFQEALNRVRQYVSHHLWLIILVSVLGLSVGLVFLYLRAVLRFVLVDAILKEEVFVGCAWAANRPLGRSYFLWLLASLVFVGTALAVAVVVAFLHFRAAAATGIYSIAFWFKLVSMLLADVIAGLMLALVITLTDDLVVPIMYAERLPLFAAWRKLWKNLRAEASTFAVYILLRFAVAVAVGVAVLFSLSTVLVFLFSGTIIAGALVVLALRLLGVMWTWNPITITLASMALLLLIGVMFILLSVVGMPGQVLIQDFGIHFIACRVPSLESLLYRSAAPSGEG